MDIGRAKDGMHVIIRHCDVFDEEGYVRGVSDGQILVARRDDLFPRPYNPDIIIPYSDIPYENRPRFRYGDSWMDHDGGDLY